MLQPVLVFIAAAAVVAVAGVWLVHAADQLAEILGIPRLLVGMLLVALATSLPEIVTDVSAVLRDAPDLAVGDLLGSSMANMAILATIDLMHRQRVWAHVEVGHARAGSVAIVLTSLAGLAMLTPAGPAIGWIGIDTAVIAGVYVAAVAWMRRSPWSRFSNESVLPRVLGWSRPSSVTLRLPLTRFLAGAAAILLAAPFLVGAAEQIAVRAGLGESFVGVLMLAATTSLPELVVSVAAVRMSAYDLAVGNLFGSNAFNMAALLVIDAAYASGPLLASVSAGLAVAALGAVLLMALALAAIVHGHETRIGRLEPDAVVLMVAYVGTVYAVWAVG